MLQAGALRQPSGPKRTGRVTDGASGLLGALGPLAVGLLAEGFGLGWAMAALCIVPVLMLVIPTAGVTGASDECPGDRDRPPTGRILRTRPGPRSGKLADSSSTIRSLLEYIGRVESYFPFYDVLLLDDGKVVAGGWGVPLQWDGTAPGLPARWLRRSAREFGQRTRGLGVGGHACIVAAAVRRDPQGGGLAGQALTALRDRATATGLARVIAPVRPSLKTRYPLTSRKSFARWDRGDGLHLDPWIRTHQRLGATILGPAADSMIIKGTVAEWEEWAGMAFPESGTYVVPDALDLVDVRSRSRPR